MKITRRTKLLVVALALCITTMVGSTFAWFTDSVESNGNKIEAGTLELKLYQKQDDGWKDISDSTEPLFNYNLWEPGYAVWQGLKIENAGTLALKWKATFVMDGEISKLADVIDVYVRHSAEKPTRDDIPANPQDTYPTNQNSEWWYDGTLREFINNAETNTYGKLAGKEKQEMSLVLKMREEAGNEYQGLSLGNFDLKIIATQDVVENDSFGNDYDADATYPKIGEVDVYSEADLKSVKEGGIANIRKDIDLTEAVTLPADTVLRGNGYQINGTIYAGGNLTIEGHVKVTAFSANYYDRTITIGEGACLEVTGTGRVTLGYGNTFNITGMLENAKTADKANVQPSLIIPGGISITGGNDAVMNVTNAYVKIGNTSSKNSAANGTFTLNFTNSIAEFTNQLTLSEPTNGNNPTFNINIKDSVLTTATKLCIAAPNSNVVIDNSTVTLATYFRNSGNVMLKNGSVLTGSTIQFGENGGNNGTITVDDSSFTITASSTGHAFDGKDIGKIVLQNGATANVDYYKDMTVDVDTTSTFTGTEVQ